MEPPSPQPIRRLQEALINRIAAGEIIHRPASALKELLENALDAGSTSIRITVKDGGLKLLQIQDNGSGIRKADLPILAERFTTSKISAFSDLSSLKTYGFRGEALASMSHVAQLTVMTKTKSDTCAWKACYSDGKLVPAQAGQDETPKPCAGNDGTTLIIENLFFNTPTRLAALRNPADEYARILDVITKYAIHNPHVAFLCKKSSSPSPSLSSPSSSTTAQAIRLLYGHSIAKELINIKIVGAGSEEEDKDDAEGENDWTAEAHFTSANYQAKKTVFLLFINHRLVESSRLKRALEAAYTGVLPKGTFPFIYLSLLLDPRTVDVNVHPTKSAVHFLNEDAIIEKIADEVQRVLAERCSKSRGFDVGKQTLITSAFDEPEVRDGSKTRRGKEAAQEDDSDDPADEDSAPLSSTSSSVKKPVYSHHKVRTSLKDRTLDSMFPVSNPSEIGVARGDKGKGKAATTAIDVDMDEVDPHKGASTQMSKPLKDIKESQCYLSSVSTLRSNVTKAKHRNLSDILGQHTFVGIVDLDKCLSLVQYSTKLYLVNHASLGEELFYQLGLRQFGDMQKIKLQPPPSLKTLISIAVEAEEIPDGASNLTKPDIVQRITDILLPRREMLQEYFSLTISPTGDVETLPLLLPGFTPSLDKLPYFLMRLGPQVNWGSEIECFETFLRELAYFYAPGLGPFSGRSSSEPMAEDDAEFRDQELKAERWQIQHVLFPSLRKYLVAPKSLLDGAGVVQVANLPDLYKVFERC